VKGKKISTYKVAKTVNAKVEITEGIITCLKFKGIKANVTLYIVDDTPVDILLGTLFLSRYSKGYRIMKKEFEPDEVIEDAVMAVEVEDHKDQLEALLDKYPKLVLEKGEMPEPTRYYKGVTFELGIPDDMRDKVFFRPKQQQRRRW